MFKLLTLLMCIQLAIGFEIDSCSINSDYMMMSTKTSYDLVANKQNTKDFKLSKCQQVGFWHLSRHGQRYPDELDIIKMNENLLSLKEKIVTGQYNGNWLCAADLNSLKSWTPRIKPEDDNQLTPRGIQVMRELGQRMRKRLTDFDSKFEKRSQIYVQSTNTSRTIQSAQSYLSGFSKKWIKYLRVNVTSKDEDRLLKYPDLCPKFDKTTDKSQNPCPEAAEFTTKSVDYLNGLNRFRNRIDSSISDKENEKNFEDVLKMCQYEYLIDGVRSIWCKFIDEDMLKLVEYREDLKYHCKYGYKFNISREMTCDLVSDLTKRLTNIQMMEDGMAGEAFARAILYFTHSSSMLPFFAAMDLFHNENDFNFNNVTNINPNRSFKISWIGPMNSNIAFVLYKCKSDGKSYSGVDEEENIDYKSENKKNKKKFVYKLRAFQNENLVKPIGCSTADNCNLDEFVSYLSTNFLSQCKSTAESCSL